MRLALALASLALVLPAVAGPAAATTRTVTFPLVVDHPILEAALRRDLGMEDDAALELWGTPGDCHWAVLDDLAFSTDGGKLLLAFKGSTVAGFRLLWFCISPFAWQGSLRLRTRPVVGRDWQLRFETLELEARDADGAPSPLTNSALQLVRAQLEERLHAFHFDLAPPMEEAKALIRAAVVRERSAPVLAVLDTLRPLTTGVDGDGVRVEIALDVPESAEQPAGAEPALSEAEVAAWEERIDRWESFLVFTVKILATATDDRGVRDELLDILLDARRELVDVLRQGPVPGTDPVRRLFLSAWDRIRAQARRAIHRGAFGDRTHRFISFLAAGDALAAIDQAGPGLGLEISADGLRRLARLVDPAERADPIPVTEAVDSELRALFGFRSDLGEETPPAPPTTAVPTTTAPPATLAPDPTTGTPDSTVPPSTTPPAPTTAPTSTLPLSWLWSPREAAAATVDLAALGRKLDRWVPKADELRTYRDLVDRLITTVAAHRLDRFEGRLRTGYRNLVPAVAWQESCWRHFVEKNGTVTFLYSRTGDVGLMQVNRRVWRGFFEIPKLQWDIVYNAAAGAEILAQLLARVGPKEADRSADAAARATYSAYNAGPGAYARYRNAKPKSLGRAIDESFYEKYRMTVAGTAGDLVLCMG